MINILQMLQSVRNPQALIQNAMNNPQIQNNPITKNAMDMYSKGDMSGLKNLAMNLAKEQGVSLEDLMKSFGI